jgi:phosphoglucosamine mutase
MTGWVAMLERYRTLGAMLALGEFSVPDIAALAQVGESTVRTVLRREARYVEKVGAQRTGRRGGQPIRWRLRPEARESIREILEKLEGLGAGPWLDASEPDSPTAAVLAAEHVVLRLIPKATDSAERTGLIELARTQVETVKAAVTQPGAASHISDHLRVVSLLLDLEEMEQSREQGDAMAGQERVRQTSIDLLLAAGRTQDKRLGDAVSHRVKATPLGMPEEPVHGRKLISATSHAGQDSRIPGYLFGPDFLISHAQPSYPTPVTSYYMTERYRDSGTDVVAEDMGPGRLFGTDGVRGVAGRDLSASLAVDLAMAAAHVLARPSSGDTRPVAVIGRDRSSSSQFLESAIIAGLTSSGVDVIRIGEAPAAAIAFLTADHNASLGVMLSPSHSRAPYNGIKFFARGGYKLSDSEEEQIEQRLLSVAERGLPALPASGFGVVTDAFTKVSKYLDHVLSTLEGDPSKALAGMRVVVDCANGAASKTAPDLLRRAGAHVVAIGVSPDGQNINAGAGSTDPKALIAQVNNSGADAGIGYDGDADGCIAVDHLGRFIDGDQILAVLALDLANQGKLAHRTVVATVMSNLGFRLAMQEAGISVVETPVGDRYIADELRRGDYSLGGTQSGRIIIGDHATGPDGLLVSLNLLAIAARSGKPLANITDVMTRHPQVLVNVGIPVDETPLDSSDRRRLRSAVHEAATELSQHGRILLRPSGTEPVVRVMVEDDDHGQAERLAQQLADTVRELV